MKVQEGYSRKRKELFEVKSKNEKEIKLLEISQEVEQDIRKQ